MRAIFGALSLLVVLAIVGSLASKQLQGFDVGGGARPDTAAASQAQAAGVRGAIAADAGSLTVPQQSKALQDKVRDDAVRVLQQGADRSRQSSEQN